MATVAERNRNRERNRRRRAAESTRREQEWRDLHLRTATLVDIVMQPKSIGQAVGENVHYRQKGKLYVTVASDRELSTGATVTMNKGKSLVQFTKNPFGITPNRKNPCGFTHLVKKIPLAVAVRYPDQCCDFDLDTYRAKIPILTESLRNARKMVGFSRKNTDRPAYHGYTESDHWRHDYEWWTRIVEMEHELRETKEIVEFTESGMGLIATT